MDRERFISEAEAGGMSLVDAEALYKRLYPVGAEPPAAEALPRRSPVETENALGRVVQVFIWLGIFLLIIAHAWWSHLSHSNGVFLMLTLIWLTCFLAASEWTHQTKLAAMTGGFAAIAVVYAAVAVYAAERLAGVHIHDHHGFHGWISGGAPPLEAVAAVAAAAALHRYRRPFLMLPLTQALTVFALDGLIHALNITDRGDHTVAGLVLTVALMIWAAALWLDLLGWRRFAFWPHLIAIGLSLGSAADLIHRPAGLLCGFVLLAIGLWLARTSYLVIGGICVWTGFDLYSGPLLPLLSMVGGLALIGTAILLAVRDSPLRRFLASRELPAPQRDLSW